jgi:hypothetical protein
MSRNKAQNASKARVASDEDRLAFGDEPSLVKFDYLKLRETLEAIVASMEAASQPAEGSEDEQESAIRLVVSNDEPDSVDHPDVKGSEKPAA